MAFDAQLAARLRPLLVGVDGVVEKKMFGGLAFLVHGHVSIGVHGNELIVRIDPAQTDAALAQPGVRMFDITGRPMKGWVMVAPEVVAKKSALDKWVVQALAFVHTLAPK